MLITLGSRIEIFHSSRPSFGAQKHSSFFNTILDDDSWDLKGGMYTLPSPCLETVHARLTRNMTLVGVTHAKQLTKFSGFCFL